MWHEPLQSLHCHYQIIQVHMLLLLSCCVLPAAAGQAWYMNPAFSVLIGGILPFGAVFIELFFILTSMWLHQFYYLFGFLCLVFVILIITCAEITIVLCYFQLCSEDYHWWCGPINATSRGCEHVTEASRWREC